MTAWCAACKFAKSADKDKGKEFECRRFPATTHSPHQIYGQWPRVYTHDWCGEFKNKCDLTP